MRIFLSDEVFDLSPTNIILLFQKNSRKYDIDSLKKTLKRNTWEFITAQIYKLSKIDNIGHVGKLNLIIHETLKEFERNVMESSIEELFNIHYNVSRNIIMDNLIFGDLSQKNGITKELDFLLKKKFKDYFYEYRNTERFFLDVKRTSKNDSLKAKRYFEVSRKFINYLNHPLKVNLLKLTDDDSLPANFNITENLTLKQFKDQDVGNSCQENQNFYIDLLNANLNKDPYDPSLEDIELRPYENSSTYATRNFNIPEKDEFDFFERSENHLSYVD